MKVELGIGVLMITCLGFAMGSCEKAKKDKVDEIEVVSEYNIVADSIRIDSTIENREQIAFACESLFDQKFLKDGMQVPSKQLILEHISVDSLNGESLLQISYHSKDNIERAGSIDLYFLDSDFKTTTKGTIRTYRAPKPEFEIADFNDDGIEEIKVGVEKNYTSVSYFDYDESIYTFDKENGLDQLFTIMTLTRNCTAIMNENWNYSTRSYKFISTNKIEVRESNYLIDCEQFERMGSVSKLRKVSSKTYPVEL